MNATFEQQAIKMLEDWFDWLGTDEEANGPATISQLNDLYQFLKLEEERYTDRTCDQCTGTAIQGSFCHERGCINSKKTWQPGEWV